MPAPIKMIGLQTAFPLLLGEGIRSQSLAVDIQLLPLLPSAVVMICLIKSKQSVCEKALQLDRDQTYPYQSPN